MTEPILCAIGDDCRGSDPDGEQIPPRRCWDSAVICDVCRGRLERWIANLPALCDALTEALIPGNGSFPPKMGGATWVGISLTHKGREHSIGDPWPLNPAAIGLAGDAYGKLASWTLLVVEERNHTPPQAELGEVRKLADWLTMHIDWISHQDWAPAMYHEIQDLHWEVRRVAYPDRQRKRFLLPRHRRRCPECGGDMYAVVAGDTNAGTMIQCSGCGHEWPPIQWFRLGRRILATPTQPAVLDQVAGDLTRSA